MSAINKKWVIAALAILLVAALGLTWGLTTSFGRRSPRPTPRPEAELPWDDDFSEPGNWQAESDAAAQVEVQDGVMRVYIAAPNQLAWASNGREFSDFSLTVEAAQVAGPDDNEYGVLVRMEDTDHFYRFSISGDGYYMVSKYDGEVWESLNGDWAISDAIQTGTATNLLKVVCQGATMIFFVNGEQLVQIDDADYSRGDVALYAGSFFEPEVEVHFDNLRVEEP